MVDQYSTLVTVMTSNVVTVDDVTTEMDSWQYLTLYNESAQVTDPCTALACTGVNTDFFSIGLFAHDLTDFKADCVTSDNCVEGNYNGYDGWAVGMMGQTYLDVNS